MGTEYHAEYLKSKLGRYSHKLKHAVVGQKYHAKSLKSKPGRYSHKF